MKDNHQLIKDIIYCYNEYSSTLEKINRKKIIKDIESLKDYFNLGSAEMKLANSIIKKIPRFKELSKSDSFKDFHKYFEELKKDNFIKNNKVNSIIKEIYSIFEKLLKNIELIKNAENVSNISLKRIENTEDVENIQNRFKQIENSLIVIIKGLEDLPKIKEQIEVIFKFNSFKNNLIILGANGSGKSSYAKFLKETFPLSGVFISAQKQFPSLQKMTIGPYNDELFKSLLDKPSLYKDYSSYNYNSYNPKQNEETFTHCYEQIISKHLKTCSENREIGKEVKTDLDKILKIWNELMVSPQLFFNDKKFNIQAENNGSIYDFIKLSDGEKALFYFLLKIIPSKENGIIIVDEPETFLHKSIVKKAWDKIENIRNDCHFIYITHDIDFAESRKGFEKYWIKSYSHSPSPTFYNWKFEKIKSTDIPEKIYLELLGSKKNILFCEGEEGSLDKIIYEAVYGEEFTVKPVGSCTNVINYTKSLNKLKNHIQAYGIIDRDYNPDNRKEKLKKDNIYLTNVAEIENLFLTEEILKAVLKDKKFNSKEITNKIEKIKVKIFKTFNKNKELQISQSITSKLDFIKSDSNIKSCKNKDEIQDNLDSYIKGLKKWEDYYREEEKTVNKIIDEKNYKEALKYYNNKGLIGSIQSLLDEKNLEDFILRGIRNGEYIETLKKGLPNIDSIK